MLLSLHNNIFNITVKIQYDSQLTRYNNYNFDQPKYYDIFEQQKQRDRRYCCGWSKTASIGRSPSPSGVARRA